MNLTIRCLAYGETDITYEPTNQPVSLIRQKTLNIVNLFTEDSVNSWRERTEAAFDGLGGCNEIKWVSLYCPVLWCSLQGGMLL